MRSKHTKKKQIRNKPAYPTLHHKTLIFLFSISIIAIVGTIFFAYRTGSLTGHAATLPTPLKLISRGVPVFGSSQLAPITNINDLNYTNGYQGMWVGNIPGWAAFNLSSVPQANRSQVLLGWYNDPVTSAYDHVAINDLAYNNLGAYSIQCAIQDPSITTVPTSWPYTVATVTGNVKHSRQHLVSLVVPSVGVCNWVRLNITASDGSSGNTNVMINVDIYDASAYAPGAPIDDDWMFFGDSITQEDMSHGTDQAGMEGFNKLIYTATNQQYLPMVEDGGMGGWDTNSFVSHITGNGDANDWLSLFQGKYVAISLGTNDANSGCNQATIVTPFKNNYIAMIHAVLAKGKVPVVPYIPWAPSTNVQNCAGDPNTPVQLDSNGNPLYTNLNQVIKNAIYTIPGVLQGPDLWTAFNGKTNLFRDALHPSDTTDPATSGFNVYRAAWRDAMLAAIYNGTQASVTPTTPVTMTPTMPAGATATPTVTIIPTSTQAPTPTLTPIPTSTPIPTPTTGTANSSVTLVGTGTGNGNFGGGVKVKVPTVQAGDLLIAAAGTNGSPASWTTPTGWTAGANSGHPDGQGLNWFWKIATAADSGATVTLKSAAYADGGGIVIAYRGASSSPIRAVSAFLENNGGGSFHVTSATFNTVPLSGSANVVSLLLASWQPTNAVITWPAGYTAQATATDSYGYIVAAANLSPQVVTTLSARTVTLSTAQAIVPTLQIAILVGP